MKPEGGKLSIPEWSKEDRPRERLLARGAKALSDAELVAILIRSGTPTDSALDLARIILNKAGNDLHKLAAMGVSELMRIHGVGEAKAMSIVAALELGQRRRDLAVSQRPLISDSRSAFELLQPVLGDLPYEEFWLLLLDRGNRLMNRVKVSQGGMHGTVADPKLIFREALDQRASSVILCHNHPSGQLRPSAEDIQLTRKLVEGGRFLEIQVQDHLIVTNAGYFSFADNGQLN
ncbi:MAG: DNA repair protein RadC [Flavobacteriales bacterium]|nr:DNA repair protein RadC [Flavobacteriales bacterium]MCB9163497.1 DNA repair protein RadC [Flavobacteriales bacterium]MCB9179195.1 DNA repair protein RadC [Flavobacteriales bacterium]